MTGKHAADALNSRRPTFCAALWAEQSVDASQHDADNSTQAPVKLLDDADHAVHEPRFISKPVELLWTISWRPINTPYSCET
jgi:hypothetical protein